MDEQNNSTAEAAADSAAAANPNAAQPARNPPQKARSVSDPREVAAMVMARIGMVNTKKDELTIAIKGLSDVAQQLARAYAEQRLLIDGLARRVKTLEAAAAGTAHGVNGNGAAAYGAAQEQRAD